MNTETKASDNYLHIADGSRVLIVQDEDNTKEEKDDSQHYDYWYLVKNYKWKILSLTLIIGLLTALFVDSPQQPIYSSTARLLIETDPTNVIAIEEVSGVSSDRHFETQLKILTSRKLLEKLVDKLKLVSHPAFAPKQKSDSDWHWSEWLPTAWHKWFIGTNSVVSAPPPTPEERRKAIVNTIIKNLSVIPVRGTQLVDISFESPDAQLAAIIPNSLADVYIENDLQAKFAITKKAAAWLNKRLKELRNNLRQSEKKLQNYMQRQNIVDVSGIKSIAVRQIDEIASNLISARLRLIEAELVYKQVRQFRGKSNKNIESLPVILNHTLIQEMKAVELAAGRRLSEQSQRYGPRHPNIIAAKAELKTAKNNTATQIKLVIDGIIKEYQMAVAHVRILEQTLKEKKDEIKKLNRKESELLIFQREVDVNRQLYELFLTRYKETQASQDIQALQSTVGRVIEPALVSTSPYYKQNKKQVIIIALVLGFIISTLLAFLVEFFNNTIKNREDVEQKLGLALLETLPRIKAGKKNKPQWMFLKAPKSQFAESVRTIRTGILLSKIDNPQKILLVTSSVMGEGKTTVSINQAFALGQLGKTLLIEADMRRPSMANLFGWSTNPPAPGLSELVIDRQRPMKECIRQMAEELNVDIISSGTIPPDPLELLSSERFKEIFKQLCQDYKYIIIDSPPTLLVSDAMVLAKYASEVLYVVKADATPTKVVLDGLKRLRQVDIQVRNIILNQVETQKYPSYYGN